MARTYPTSLGELVVWLAEDVRVNRERGGGLSVLTVLVFRLSQFGSRARGPAAVAIRWASLPWVVFSRLLLSCEIPGSIDCGRRLVLAHGGRGVIVVAGASLGNDVVMAPFSSVGTAYPLPGVPVIGDGVYLGAHSTVLGPITVGAGSFVGAHALVTRDLAPGSFAPGATAEVVEPSEGRSGA